NLTDAYDILPVENGREISVPLQGVRWSALVVLGVTDNARARFGVRALADFPFKLRRWDFTAAEDRVSLAWETDRHESLTCYVVEALAVSEGGGWRVLRQSLIPVAADGESPFAYSFADDDARGAAAYRVLALTHDGLLAEVGTFPLAQDNQVPLAPSP
ncbi:MAG: hypothetical protein V1750_02085, partial [Acidobacteriota bacterium]